MEMNNIFNICYDFGKREKRHSCEEYWNECDD